MPRTTRGAGQRRVVDPAGGVVLGGAACNGVLGADPATESAAAGASWAQLATIGSEQRPGSAMRCWGGCRCGKHDLPNAIPEPYLVPDCDTGLTAAQPHQMISTVLVVAMRESAVTNGKLRAIAVAVIRRSHGSRSDDSGMLAKAVMMSMSMGT